MSVFQSHYIDLDPHIAHQYGDQYTNADDMVSIDQNSSPI